ncbi:hypothetical protein BHE74_00050705, partial [Ensete ventricosum]
QQRKLRSRKQQETADSSDGNGVTNSKRQRTAAAIAELFRRKQQPLDNGSGQQQ